MADTTNATTKEEARVRVQRLRDAINKHRYEYHVLDAPTMTDEAFDSLKHELKLLEDTFPDLITPDSPTQRVGGEPLESFAKVPHVRPMLSIEDIFTPEELEEWEVFLQKRANGTKVEYFCEGKMDGLAIALRYEDGVFTRAITRGNGLVGEDVTANVKTIESVPLRLGSYGADEIAKSGTIEVRGEVYISQPDFARFNAARAKEGEQVYANPRNLAAGSIRQLDPALTATRPLSFRAYDIATASGLTTHNEKHAVLRSFGFATDPSAKVCPDISSVVSYWRESEKRREKNPAPLDGVVVRVNDSALFERLGVAGKSPRGIRAFKFTPRQTTTKLLDIRVQVGRTGAVTPIAVLSPVPLAGVTVSRATLHNADEIERLGVRVGDTVIVERAGDVIPAITGVIAELRDGSEKAFRMPTKCPVCATVLTRKEGEVAWRCPNTRCESRRLEALSYFVSRKNFDIEGLGSKVVNQLVEAGLIADAADIFTLKQGDLEQLERFGETSAKNLIDAVDASKRISLARFISALNIRHVGEETAIDLANHFGSINAIASATREELEALDGVGMVVAESVFEWFSEQKNQEFLTRLLKAGVVVEVPTRSGTTLAGKTFVFTGTLSTLSREEAHDAVRAFGGSASSSVSSKTTFVVAGDDPGSKADEARKLGVPLIDEQAFLKLIGR